jgi:hypothetical protein
MVILLRAFSRILRSMMLRTGANALLLIVEFISTCEITFYTQQSVKASGGHSVDGYISDKQDLFECDVLVRVRIVVRIVVMMMMVLLYG